MNPLDLIRDYYRPGTLAYEVLVRHCEAVTGAALCLAERVSHLVPDPGFIREAAMLHDIGVFDTDAPQIGCFGKHPYICHGYLGRMMLEKHGLPDHARVCERHIGAGLSAEDISAQKLPLPKRDMLPETVAEQIICFADSFFSKTPPPGGTRRSADAVIASLSPYGADKVERFYGWLGLFGTVG
ncbi:MAG: HDIG domain-containing protein [Desulfobacterales bacterium]|nr:HDIG domain-containing protein [Desulfobacterales bacterium]